MNNLKYWLAAAHAANITPRQIYTWLETFDDIKHLMTASMQTLKQHGIAEKHAYSLTHINSSGIDTALQWSDGQNCHLIAIEDSDYPSLLREIADPPLVLFVQGDRQVLNEVQLAIVGARQVTAYGERNAREFATALAQTGFVITSGLAIGVDGVSHRGALNVNGKTIAVVGSGLNYIYPPRHRPLARQIVEQGGALVSEFPLAMQPKPYHFPRRNRIISGLSRGVLVVEAAVKSGSLVTARHASEQGREVFAIPGNIHAPLARGCHHLLRSGAKLTEQVSDILEEFPNMGEATLVDISSSPAIMPTSLLVDEQKIYEKIGASVTPVDEIILHSGLTVSEVSSILLSLELHGHIRAVTGGYVR